MSPSINEWVNKFFTAWNSHEVEQAEKFYAEDYIGNDVAQVMPQQGRAGVKAFFARYLNAVPDFRFTIEDVVADGDRVAVVWTVRGTHQGALMNIPPTGRTISSRGVSLLTIQDERVQRATYIWDVAGLLRNIGLLPELS
jgi:steroid delta-isomerase-like uncharacterized protein